MDELTIDTVERAIIDRLKSRLPDVLVEPFPDNPAEYRLTHPKGAVLVSFSGSTFSAPDATDVIVQDRKMEFDVTVATKNLRAQGAHQGAYVLLEATRIALTGYKIPGYTRIYPKRDGFIAEAGGTWQYGVRFALTAPAIEMEEDEQLVLLTKITAVDDYGGVEVPK